MARPKKARVEGAQTIAGFPASDDLIAIVEAFKAAHPAEWEAIRLCPLQHGLEDMARLLK